MKKRVLSLMLAVVMALSLAVPALGANPVTEEMWYDNIKIQLSDVTRMEEKTDDWSGMVFRTYYVPTNATVTISGDTNGEFWKFAYISASSSTEEGVFSEVSLFRDMKTNTAYTYGELNRMAQANAGTEDKGKAFDKYTFGIMSFSGSGGEFEGADWFEVIFDGTATEKPAETPKPAETAKPVEPPKPEEPEKDSKWEIKELAAPLYSNIFRTEDGAIQAVQDGKSVWLDGNGKAFGGNGVNYSFREGLAKVNQSGKWGFVDTNGKEVIPCQYSRVGDFHEGLAAVYQSDGTLGYIDKNGKTVISFARGELNDVYDFSEGLARITKNGKMGFINKAGAVVVPCEYDQAYDFRGGLARVAVDSNGTWKWGLVNAQGKEVVSCQYDSMDNLYDGFVKVCKADKWGVVNAEGQEVIPCAYGSVGANACKGLATVDINGTYSYISVATGTVYTEAQACGEGMARVSLGENPWSDGKWGIVDATGKEIVPCNNWSISDFSEGLVAVSQNGNWGFVDTNGKEVIPCQYPEVSAFSEGLASVRMMDSYLFGFIDKAGNVVIPGTYEGALGFSQGLAAVYVGTYPNQKWGFIDTAGKEVIPGKYDSVAWNYYVPGDDVASGFHSNGVVQVGMDGKWGLIDLSGNELAPCKYDAIGIFQRDFQDHFIDARIDGKYGLIDDEGEEVVACEYESVKILGDGFVAVKQDGKWGLLSITEKKEEDVPAPQEPTTYTANPTNDTLKVDGKARVPTAYKIGDSNYFQLRDVAMMLNGTKAQFSVDYDPERQAVVIVTGEPYKPLGTELAGAAKDSTEAILGNNDIYINGEKADFAVYKINGANFFQIRALGQALGFNVGWTKADGMFIESDKPYDPAN